MRPMLRAILLAPLVAILASCGPSLGTYDLAGVTLVEAEAIRKIEEHPGIEYDLPNILRIELLSKTNLAKTEDVSVGNLYMFADFCPYKEDTFMLFGPYFGDQTPLGYQVQPGPVAKVEERQPPWDAKRQGFVYTLYARPFQQHIPATKPGQIEIKGYDLRSDTRDLCVRMSQTGYFLTGSESGIIVIPRAMIAKALGLPR